MILKLKNASIAKNIYMNLKLRAQIIEEKMGEGLSNPALFGQMLIDSPTQQSLDFKQVMEHSFRLLPNLSRFANEIVEWSRTGLRI